MSDLRELYQEVILDHGRHPRNFGGLDSATHHKEGFNPLCGDKVILHVELQAGVISKIKFDGCGCAISMASASLMTEAAINKNAADIETLFTAFHDVVTQGNSNDLLGKLTIFAGVADYPMRVKCATLGWHTLKTLMTEAGKL